LGASAVARRGAEHGADRGADRLLFAGIVARCRGEHGLCRKRVQLAVGLQRTGAAFAPAPPLGIGAVAIGRGGVAARHRGVARRAESALVGDQHPLEGRRQLVVVERRDPRGEVLQVARELQRQLDVALSAAGRRACNSSWCRPGWRECNP
jgi:hypothetical protein